MISQVISLGSAINTEFVDNEVYYGMNSIYGLLTLHLYGMCTKLGLHVYVNQLHVRDLLSKYSILYGTLVVMLIVVTIGDGQQAPV